MSSKKHENDITQFGILQNNYEWVECESKSEPGKLYYFNLKTTCTTWNKPVSRFTNIPRFSLMKTPSRVASSADSPPLIVSDEETKDEDHNDPSVDRIDKRTMMKSNVLHYLSRLNDNQGHISNKALSNDTLDFNGADSSTKPNEKEDRLEDFVKSPIDAQTSSESSGSNCSSTCGTCRTCSSDSNENDCCNDDGMSNSSSSACPCCIPQLNQETNNESGSEYAVPRLKRIEPSDLLVTRLNKNRRKNSRSAATRLRGTRPTKLICNMYGTRTINYNFLENVTAKSNTSDLSHSSGLSIPGKEETPHAPKYDDNDLLNIPGPNLSESSTCSSAP